MHSIELVAKLGGCSRGTICVHMCIYAKGVEGTQCMWSTRTLELWQNDSLLANNATAFCAGKVSVEAPVLPEVYTPMQLEVPGICLAWFLFKALPLVLYAGQDNF